jgi:hypothetical protein
MMAKVNALRELQCASGEDLSPTPLFGDAGRSALILAMVDTVRSTHSGVFCRCRFAP